MLMVLGWGLGRGSIYDNYYFLLSLYYSLINCSIIQLATSISGFFFFFNFCILICIDSTVLNNFSHITFWPG